MQRRAPAYVCVCEGGGGFNECEMSGAAAEKRRRRRHNSSPQSVLFLINYVLCVQPSVQEASAPLCILTAQCKWLAGGDDFREKVTLRPSVHINDSFIHFQVYKSR